MDELKNKSKSMKVNFNSDDASNIDSARDYERKRKASTKRKLKIKKKTKREDNPPNEENKVEKLAPQHNNPKLNTIAFDIAENEKKKYDFILDDTDPDLKFDPRLLEPRPTKPRETIVLEPVRPNKFDSI